MLDNATALIGASTGMGTPAAQFPFGSTAASGGDPKPGSAFGSTPGGTGQAAANPFQFGSGGGGSGNGFAAPASGPSEAAKAFGFGGSSAAPKAGAFGEAPAPAFGAFGGGGSVGGGMKRTTSKTQLNKVRQRGATYTSCKFRDQVAGFAYPG